MPHDCIKLELEPQKSSEHNDTDSTPSMEHAVKPVMPYLTSLAIGQIQLQSLIDLCTQTLRAVQESILSMNT